MAGRKKALNEFSEQALLRLPVEKVLTAQDIAVPSDSQRQRTTKTKPHFEGHRNRLRRRYLESNGKSLADYEFLELLLFRSVPRADTKPLAKALLSRFGSLADVFGADIRLLQEVDHCGPAVALDLKIIGQVNERINRSTLSKRNIFSSWDKVVSYCKAAMAHETKEQFRVLFLDKKNGLIKDEVQQTGTIDHTPVYPREVIKRALELSASALILVHNHPSGDPSPSREDVAMTQKIKEAAAVLNITLHDHLIIGRNGYSSLKKLELL